MKKVAMKNVKLQYLLSIFEKTLEKFSIFLGSTFLKNIIKRLKRLKLKQFEKLIKTFEVEEDFDEQIDNETVETEAFEDEDLEASENFDSSDNYLNKVKVICFFWGKLKVNNKLSNICYSFIKHILCSNFVSELSGSFVGRVVTEIRMKYQKTIISSLKKLRSLNILNSFRTETKKENYFDAYKYLKKGLRKLRKKLSKIKKEKAEPIEEN